MAAGVSTGIRVGPFDACLDAELVRAFASATNDPHPAVQAGEIVQPVALVTQIWAAQDEARETLVSAVVQRTASGGVHGEHDVVLHRPIAVGERLRVWVEGAGSRPAGRNALVTLHYVMVDERDEVVAEQWWTTVYLGTTCDSSGNPAPDHSVPDDARGRRVGTRTLQVDHDLARRYAEVSGDWSAHHFDVAAARATGADRVFLHGLCTMALCARAVTELVADGDPERLRRIAVRFAAPMYLGEELVIAVDEAAPFGHAFEATSAGAEVITQGLAVVV
jgi:acyl dehydratase